MASYAFEQAIAHLEAQAARDKTSSNPFGISRDMFETWRSLVTPAKRQSWLRIRQDVLALSCSAMVTRASASSARASAGRSS